MSDRTAVTPHNTLAFILTGALRAFWNGFVLKALIRLVLENQPLRFQPNIN